MKTTTMKKNLAACLFAAAGLLLHPVASQANVIYTIDINTAPLGGSPSDAPFYLDFQFATGSGAVGNNTISLGNFVFTGGSATGSATTFGSATGDLSSSVTLMDSTTPSELYQQFTSGTTDIRFAINSTLNVDAGLTPDMFSVAILDSSLGYPAQIYTSSPDTLSLFTETITSPTTLHWAGYQGVGPADGSNSGAFNGVMAIAVPEPSTYSYLAGGFVLLLALHRRKIASK